MKIKYEVYFYLLEMLKKSIKYKELKNLIKYLHLFNLKILNSQIKLYAI